MSKITVVKGGATLTFEGNVTFDASKNEYTVAEIVPPVTQPGLPPIVPLDVPGYHGALPKEGAGSPGAGGLSITARLGEFHSWDLPVKANGKGLIQLIEAANGQGNVTHEAAIGLFPGDFSYCHSDAACLIGRGNVKSYPCYAKGDPASGVGVKWNPPGTGDGGCAVPPGQARYFSVRVAGNVAAGVPVTSLLQQTL